MFSHVISFEIRSIKRNTAPISFSFFWSSYDFPFSHFVLYLYLSLHFFPIRPRSFSLLQVCALFCILRFSQCVDGYFAEHAFTLVVFCHHLTLKNYKEKVREYYMQSKLNMYNHLFLHSESLCVLAFKNCSNNAHRVQSEWKSKR